MDECLLVVGNGFELNLGLKTAYADFLDSSQFNSLLGKSSLADYLKNVKTKDRWIDIEAELARFSKANAGLKNIATEYRALCLALLTYIDSIDTKTANEQSYAGQLISEIASKQTDLSVVNFNYTNTVEMLLSKAVPVAGSRISFRYLHGSAKEKNIVFWVDDNADVTLANRTSFFRAFVRRT